MNRFVLAIVLLAGCKERGTISIPLVEPCASREASEVAVYLKPAADCTDIIDACAPLAFECTGDCAALCPDGYCTIDEVRSGLAIDPEEAGDYVLVMSFRYGGAMSDEGITCFDLKVDADGTTSMTLAPEDAPTCCTTP